MEEIPIRINRKHSKQDEMKFKILPIERKLQLSCRREKTYHSNEKQLLEMKNERKHDTLDPKKMKGENRYRRISSSGGTHKFPKDFFHHNDLPKTPIKIRFSRTKKEINNSNNNLIQSNASNPFDFITSSLNQFLEPKKKYTLESPEKNCEPNHHVNQVETPKFNLKYFADEEDHEGKIKTTHQRIKLDQYLSQKKEQFPNFFRKTGKKEQNSSSEKTSPDEKKENVESNGKTTLFEINPYENQILLETLGKNDNVLKKTVIETKERKRNQSNMEKENRKPCEPEKTSKKGLKGFLETKGLNWKIIQKINFMKQELIVEEQKAIPSNLRLKKTMTNLRKNLSEKFEDYEDPLGNAFRIRKFT